MLVAGQACLIVALGCALYGIAASLYGGHTHRREWVASGRRAVYAMAGATAIAFVTLELAFVNSDFDFAVVASHSSTTTPLFYRLTAMWSSQEGSLLLWLFLLGTWSSLILYITRHRLRMLAPYAQAVLLGFGAFFASLLVFAESPFSRVPMPVTEGVGPEPAAARPGDDDPPADALFGLHAVRGPVRVRGGGPDHAPAGRGVDPLDAPVHDRRLVRARLRDRARRALVATTSSTGAATGCGTRSRTRR